MLAWIVSAIISIFSAKKAGAATAGAGIGIGSVLIVTASASYTDREIARVQNERKAYIESHRAYGEAVVSGIYQIQKNQQDAIVIVNQNVMNLQNAILSGSKQQMRKIEFKTPQQPKEQ